MVSVRSALRLRILLTWFLLALVYFAFITIMSNYGFSITGIALFVGIFLLIQIMLSDKLVLFSTGAKIVSEEEYPELHSIVRELSYTAGIPKPKVAIVNTEIPNAFATGISPKRAVVAVTTGLMRMLNKEELKAVIAHELTHIKNRDVVAITVASFLSTVAFFIMRWAMFMGMFSDRRNSGTSIIIMLISAIVWLISYLLVMALSRFREFAADEGSAIITRKPESLISALAKISGKMKYIHPEQKARYEGMNAFFIIPAISGETLLSLFSTHPPVEKRIERLRVLAREIF